MKGLLLLAVLTACAAAQAPPDSMDLRPTPEPQTSSGGARCEAAASWPFWNRYVQHFLSEDGRIVSPTEEGRTTSEAQAYALFFALVADDRPRFDRLLSWTTSRLGAGDLSGRLPAWLWAKDRSGRWGVIDANSAADADLWLAYDLLEAGRLWDDSRLQRLGRAVLTNVRDREVVALPHLGPMLLPAPHGFEIEPRQAWRLNPSYVPPQLMRRFAQEEPSGPWAGILASTVQLVKESSPRGFVADWVLYRAGRFEPDPEKGPVGSYDAIRVYLWAGMLPASDQVSSELRGAVAGLFRAWSMSGAVPERVDTLTGLVSGAAPPGFLAVLLPQAKNGQSRKLAAQLEGTLKDGLYGSPPAYFDQNLILFARGFTEGRYRFAPDGRLVPRWGEPCRRP